MRDCNSLTVTAILADWPADRLPEGGAIESHAAPIDVVAEAFHARVLPPTLVMVAVWTGRSDWPYMALKFMAAGPILRTGDLVCATMNVTGTVWLPDFELKMSVPV